jgi:hypothetical protein
MKLFYRGHNYNAHNNAIETETTKVTGTYRGVKANFKHQQSKVEHNRNLTYRGVNYSG